MVHSMLKHYDAYGLLPVWELAGNETNCMIGYHSIPVMVEAYLKGIRDFDAEKAYEAMKKTVASDRGGMNYFRELGYIPCDRENESVSKTLEYAYDYWCIAQMAKALNKEDDYLYFLKKSRNYAHLFDKSTGFMRGKTAAGQWKTPFSPLYSNHRDDEYTEGNAWQYSWFVPQDIEGLIHLHGGPEAFCIKLDSLFTIPSQLEGENASPDISGLIGQYAQGNEPSHHVAYLFNYAGQPQKSQYYLNKIMTELYKNTPDGLCGNEDCGQMSAWYIFNAMGFYPTAPSSNIYNIGSPALESVDMRMSNGKHVKVTTQNWSPENVYIREMYLNGKKYDKSYLTYDDIREGATIHFVLSRKPNYRRAISDAAVPASLSETGKTLLYRPSSGR